MIRKIGFTLAEVLITLGIIGIVAQMTIPTLMNNIDEAQYRSALKKTFSVLSQATTSIVNENSGSMAGLCSSAANKHDCLRDIYSEQLRVAKTCDEGVNGCFPGSSDLRELAGGLLPWGWGVDSSVVMQDGTSIDYYLIYPMCDTPRWGIPNICGYIVVDVNGLKKPNRMGYDVFWFMLTNSLIKPFGSPDDTYVNDCVTDPPTGEGTGCAYKALYSTKMFK